MRDWDKMVCWEKRNSGGKRLRKMSNLVEVFTINLSGQKLKLIIPMIISQLFGWCPFQRTLLMLLLIHLHRNELQLPTTCATLL